MALRGKFAQAAENCGSVAAFDIMPNPVIMVTGAHGLLGPYLCEGLSSRGIIVGVGRNSGDEICDLEQTNQVRDLMARVRPDIVVHTAAMANVDACEENPERALEANAKMVERLVSNIPDQARLITISTDQVYPDTPGPHKESMIGPINSYGRSKLAGERAALVKSSSLVLRANFFGPSRTPDRSSLSDWLTDSLAKQQPITLFEDVLFSPLHMSTLSALVADAMARKMSGVFNLGCREGRSKKDFGLLIAKHLGLQTDTVTVGRSSNIPARAARPADLRMDVNAIEKGLQTRMPTLIEEIEKL